MRKLIILTCLLFIFPLSRAQTPVGIWTDNLLYNTAKNLAIGLKTVYASTGSSIISYNKEFAELRKLSRITGLTETGISTIGWSEENNALVIGYSTTNVDLLKNNTIYNIPDINRKYIPGKKEINRIRTNGRYAYLACSFGIVLIDLVKNEIFDTWQPGDGTQNAEVWDIAFGNGNVFAATGAGVFSADLTNRGLAYFGNWTLLNSLPSPAGKYTHVLFSGNKLYVNRSGQYFSGDSVYVVDSGMCSLFSYSQGVYNNSFDPAENGFTFSSGSAVRYFYNNGSLHKIISSYPWGSPAISQAVEDKGDIWIADINSGLVRGGDMSAFSPLTLPGPGTNNAINITSKNGKTIICGGGLDDTWDNLWRPLQVSINEGNNWISISSATISDPVRALIDPFNSNHFFISTWGGGLLEYENNVLKKQFTEANSPLQTIIPGKPYVRICGMAMDENRNLWITQTEVPGTVKVLKPDGTWIVNPVTVEAPTIGDLLITRSGQKWIVLPRGYGLFVLDDNNTPDNFSDDRYKKMLITDSDSKVISDVYSLAEDLDGNIWVGTDQGPVIYYNPEKVFDENLKAFRIKIPRNDGSGLADYMLGTEAITSIAVDGANRKWLGTFNSGAYLLSPDGTTRLKNFNEANSPIFSNSISSVAIDEKSGNIWFGTSKGVISVRGDATAGQDKFSGVYSFPNPVREDFAGNVTVTGLLRDTQIRITDVSGNLVYKTVSDGGQASWDLTTYNGRRVATGVYMVFCASPDGSQSCVTKILVIN
jgi:hypothetical protein